LAFILTRIASSVHYPIYLFTFVIVGGGGYARPPWGTSRNINWGVDNITGGFNPQPPRQFSPVAVSELLIVKCINANVIHK